MTSNRVDFIDENDAGRILLALLEQVANARRADTHEHFHEVGAADGEERYIRFACDRSGEKGFSGTWRANQQYAFRNSSAKFLKFLRFLQKVDDFLQFLLGFLNAG